MKIVEIAGEKFLVGVEWFIVGKKEVKQFLKEKKPRWYVKIPRGEYVNIGIAPEDSDVDTEMLKLPLLAPSLAETQESPWAGVFALSDKEFYHMAVGENYLILPGGEVVGSRDTAQSAYFQNLEMLENWKNLNAEGTMEDLYNLLLHSEKRYYLGGSLLEKLTTPKGKKIVVGAVVSIFVLGLGTYLFTSKEGQTTVQQLNRSVIQQAITKAKTKTETNLVAGASPADMARECYRVYIESAVRNVGWTVTRALCNTSSAVIELSRDTEQRIAYVSDRMEIGSLSAKEVHPLNIRVFNTPSGKNLRAERKLIDWSNLWEDVNLTFPYDVIEENEDVVVRKRAFEASGKDPVALGELTKIKGIALTEMEVSSSGWRVKGIVKGEEEKNSLFQTSQPSSDSSSKPQGTQKGGKKNGT